MSETWGLNPLELQLVQAFLEFSQLFGLSISFYSDRASCWIYACIDDDH